MLIIKGIIIGVGKIIPGVSGGMLAISLGVYDKLIYSLNNILKDFKNNYKFLFKIFIGIFISILLLSKIIIHLLSNYYLITMFFFLGLILGSLNDISDKIRNEKKYIVFITFVGTTLLAIISINNNFYTDSKFIHFIFYFLAGILDAITMVIPGISGTSTLMMLGVYDSIMKNIAEIFNFNSLIFLFPFLLGLVFGTIITVKIVNYLLSNYKSLMYSIIKGFSFSTIFYMFLKCLNTSGNLLDFILGIFMLILGFVIIKKINCKFTN